MVTDRSLPGVPSRCQGADSVEQNTAVHRLAITVALVVQPGDIRHGEARRFGRRNDSSATLDRGKRCFLLDDAQCFAHFFPEVGRIITPDVDQRLEMRAVLLEIEAGQHPGSVGRDLEIRIQAGFEQYGFALGATIDR